jgi:hypothetical protein
MRLGRQMRPLKFYKRIGREAFTVMKPEHKLFLLEDYMNYFIDTSEKRIKFENWAITKITMQLHTIANKARDIFRNRCFYCHRPLDQMTYSRDHIVPLSNGGGKLFGNTVPCCHDCNQWKGSWAIEEWLKTVKKIGDKPLMIKGYTSIDRDNIIRNLKKLTNDV